MVDIGSYVDQYFGSEPENPALVLVRITPDVGDNDAVEESYAVRGWPEDFGSALVAQSLVPAGMSRFCVTGDSLREHGVEPTSGDFLEVDGVRHHVESATHDAVKALYVLIVVGPRG